MTALLLNNPLLWEARAYWMPGSGRQPGKVHQVDPQRRVTLCGKAREQCPGQRVHGGPDLITCKGCLASRAAAAKRIAREREWQQQETNRQQQHARWWQAYTEYLTSPVWQRKRLAVLRRCTFLCEGCGERRDTQVHHREYPRAWPGTPEWCAAEKLFHLIAICDGCHADVHAAPTGHIKQ